MLNARGRSHHNLFLFTFGVFMSLRRRDFLRLSSSAALSWLAIRHAAGCAEEDMAALLADTGPALPGRIPLSVMGATGEELDVDLKVLSGRLPREIAGHVFVVGALPFRDGSPVFNGDGIVYRLDLGQGIAGARLKTRIMKTPCYYADMATRGNPDHEFVNLGMIRMSGTLGVRNELNTAFTAFDNRLLVTYDGGRPWELDPESLELITPVGTNADWRSALPAVMANGVFAPHMSSAHPIWDEYTRELFTVNYGMTLGESMPGWLRLLRWDGQQSVEGWDVHLPDGTPVQILQSTHQVALTRDWLLLFDTSFLVEGEQIFDPSIAHAQRPQTACYLIRRSDLTRGGGTVTARLVTIDRECVHMTADYENPDGRVTVHVAHNTATDASEWLREDDIQPDGTPVRRDLLGLNPAATDINLIGHHVIDTDAGAVLESRYVEHDDHTWQLAFFTHRGQTAPGRHETLYWNSLGFTHETLTQRMVDLYGDYPHRRVPVSSLSSRSGSLFRFDVTGSQIVDAWTFPAGRFASSPQFVPRSGTSEPHKGWLVCTVVSDDASNADSTGDEFWVFDASNLQQGPVARLGHPSVNLGFTLHTTYLPSFGPRNSDYRIQMDTDHAPVLEHADAFVQQLFREHVFPHFRA